MINFKLFFESSWYNDTLPERFWDGDRFDPEVRQKLLEIAADVADKAGVVAEVQDVQLTGSMANYNYTKYSDLDVHILLDFADINSDEDLVRAALDGRRFVWNLRHNISIGVMMWSCISRIWKTLMLRLASILSLMTSG